MSPINSISASSSLSTLRSENKEKQDPAFSEILIKPPTLMPPRDLPSSEYRLLQEINKLCDIHEGVILSQKDKLSVLQEEIQEACKTYMKELEKNAEALKNNNFWSVLRKAANSLFSACSLVCGLSLSANPATAFAGGALISSGLLSITNITLTECKGWDWITEQMQGQNEETKAQLKAILPLACSVLAAGFGIAGGTAAIAANAIDLSSKAAQIAQSGFTLFNASTIGGKGISDSRLQFSNASLSDAETNLTLAQSDLDLSTAQFQRFLTDFDHTMKSSRRAIQSIIQTKLSYS